MNYQDWSRIRRYVEQEISFWERIKLPILSEGQLREKFWKHVPSVDALVEFIQKEHLTPEGLELAGRFVQVFTYSRKDSNAPEGYCTFSGFYEEIPIYQVGINLHLCDSREKQKEALFHEMCHIFYRTNSNGLNIEKVIQEETLRFIDKEKNYVEQAFARFLPILGYSYRYNTNQLPLPFVKK